MRFKRTKILATLGPPTNTYDMIDQLMAAGANGFRLNFSHGSHEERDQQIAWIRQASAARRKPVAILQDLQGPKIRLGNLLEDTPVKAGDEIVLDYAAEHSGLTFPVQYNLAEKVRPGEPIYIFEGKVQQNVISAAAVQVAQQMQADAIVAETKSGATAENIGLHRPNLPIISVTSSPRAAQQLALNYANKSFVRPDGEKAGLSLARELHADGFFGDTKQITVVIVSGRQPGVAGGTDTLRVRILE